MQGCVLALIPSAWDRTVHCVMLTGNFSEDPVYRGPTANIVGGHSCFCCKATEPQVFPWGGFRSCAKYCDDMMSQDRHRLAVH